MTARTSAPSRTACTTSSWPGRNEAKPNTVSRQDLASVSSAVIRCRKSRYFARDSRTAIVPGRYGDEPAKNKTLGNRRPITYVLSTPDATYPPPHYAPTPLHPPP